MDGSVRLVTAVGRNPAPLAQLLWALAERGERVVEVRCVVVDARAGEHLEEELLGPGGALSQMRKHIKALLPETVAWEVAEDVGEACWAAAKALTARPEPVKFAAFPGRHRRASLALATCFNFLARKRDAYVEVAVSARGAEGLKGFYFPHQAQQRVTFPDGSVQQAAGLSLSLEEVPLPRLRRLLPELSGASWGEVAAVGQRRLDALGAPELVVDLEAGRAHVGGVEVKLAPLPLAWLAALALARREGEGGGWLYSDSTAAVAEVLSACAKRPWVKGSRTKALRKLLREPVGSVEDGATKAYLSRVRHLLKQKLQRVAKKHFPLHVAELLPEVAQGHSHGSPDHRQRLPLSPEFIHVHGL